ncbi:hypothetical protein DFJ74DRAFT_720199 [Hyaloraphidium curvatum]|nr:hypothetical protein DFJ74DRAFT_720199 [Hyaloraphidium curvatum]
MSWTGKKLKVLRRVLVGGVERCEIEARGAGTFKPVWTLLQDAKELKWLRLNLYGEAAFEFDATSVFPSSVRRLVLKVVVNAVDPDLTALRDMLADHRAPRLEGMNFILAQLLTERDGGWASIAGIRAKLARICGRIGNAEKLILSPGTPRGLKRLVLRHYESVNPRFSTGRGAIEQAMVHYTVESMPRDFPRLLPKSCELRHCDQPAYYKMKRHFNDGRIETVNYCNSSQCHHWIPEERRLCKSKIQKKIDPLAPYCTKHYNLVKH